MIRRRRAGQVALGRRQGLPEGGDTPARHGGTRARHGDMVPRVKTGKPASGVTGGRLGRAVSCGLAAGALLALLLRVPGCRAAITAGGAAAALAGVTVVALGAALDSTPPSSAGPL